MSPSSPPQRSHYDVLGVPRNASQEDIKKRYREMARQYHPDVNRANPSAAQIFGQITTAYKALSDKDDRAAYDTELALQERQRAESNARRAAATGSPAGGARTGATGSRGANNGGANAAARAAQTNAGAESSRFVIEAQSAFSRGRFIEARTLAEQALRLNRRNAVAYEVIGDVYRLQNKTDDALAMYTMALQINPRNPTLMQRVERLSRSNGGASGPSAQRAFFDNRDNPSDIPGYNSGGAGGGSRSRPYATGPTGRAQRMAADAEKRPLGLMLTGIFGYGGVFLAILYAAMYPGEAPRQVAPLLGLVASWNATIMTIMAICGLLLGATMTITSTIRRIDDELILSGGGTRGGTFIPLGLIVVVVSVINFWAAAALYAVVTGMQESFTPTMRRVFGAVAAIVVLLAVVYPGHGQVLLFGGNVVFLAFVIGWLLGDFFRPDGY